jgi:aminopeptidase N
MPPALRTPGDVVALRYRLDLTVVPDQDHFTGTMHLDAELKRTTSVVWLNATGLELQDGRLDGQPAKIVAGNEDFVGLVPEGALPPGPLTIDVRYRAGIDHEKSRGVYAEKEGDQSYAYTFFEPIDARRAFPCIDEPAAKVPWQLTLHVKKDHVALANAAVEKETDEPGGMKRVDFAVTPPLPSYLVAFVVGPFEVIDAGSAADTKIRFVVPRGRSAELTWSKEIAPKVVQALVDWAALPYPYGRLDIAVVPRFWGTMEHPGLLAMGQPLMLIRPEQSTRPRKQTGLNILAHELSHYWFGDFVTTAWWDDTWLNEALGEWLDLIITDTVAPEWKVRDGRVAFSVAAMEADELLTTEAIRKPVTSREGIEASFDGEITYLKGASVLRMFEAWVGEEKWRAFLRSYLSAHRWGNVTADDFLDSMQRELGAPVSDGFRSFLVQPGVPRISAQVTCGTSSTVRLEQRRSLPPGARDATERTWKVPVCFRSGDAKSSQRTCALLADQPLEVPVAKCPTWLLLNADATGYYRSAIDAKQARAFLAPGSPGKPTVAERLMVVSDLRGAVSRGEVPLDEALKLAPLVAADSSERVAGQSFELASLRTDLFAEPWYQRAREFELQTWGPLARKLGWKRRADDSDDRQALRRQTLGAATHSGDAALAKEGGALARAWLEDPVKSGLPDDLVGLALSVAARDGDAALFERYLAAARTAPDRTAKGRLLGALGSFIDPTLAARALDLLLHDEFDLRETTFIALRLLAERETRALAFSWLQEHLDELLTKMRADESGWLLGAVAGTFCDAERRAAAEALLTPRAAKIDGAAASVARGLEESSRCIAEQKRDRPALEHFLAGFK